MAKAFSFTYSKLSGFEKCGLQFQKVDIEKTPGWGPAGDAIDYGTAVHNALHKAIGKGEELEPKMKHLQYWVDWGRRLPGLKLVEEKWGLTRDFQPVEFRTNMAWCRFIVDLAAVVPERKCGVLVDWKTGNRLEEPLQLWMGAWVMFQHFHELEKIDSMFVWLKEDDGKNSHECISVERVKRSEINEIMEYQILPRVALMEEAVRTNTFHPKPGPHCKWCKVQSCDFFGKAV